MVQTQQAGSGPKQNPTAQNMKTLQPKPYSNNPAATAIILITPKSTTTHHRTDPPVAAPPTGRSQNPKGAPADRCRHQHAQDTSRRAAGDRRKEKRR